MLTSWMRNARRGTRPFLTPVGSLVVVTALAMSIIGVVDADAVASHVLPASAPDSGVGEAPLSISDAISFRQELGLNDDPAYVAKLEADPMASRQYGIAMTEGEVHIIDQRVVIQSSLDPLTKLLLSDPSYAGLWVDQKAGGEIVIETTGDEASLFDEVQTTVPGGARVRVDHVPYSLNELTALQEQISSESADWRAAGVQIVTVGTDIQLNRVIVDVVGLTDGIAARLAAQYGPMVLVEAGEQPQAGSCVSRSNCGSPIKGGLYISGGGWACTSGYLGRTQPSGRLVLDSLPVIDRMSVLLLALRQAIA